MSDPESIVRDFMSKMERLDYDAAIALVAEWVRPIRAMGDAESPDGAGEE